MEITNLNKNLLEILKDKYVVPLYQRNFAWEVEEIDQFLQDIYASFEKSKVTNYFIGSLVVLKRKNGDFEIIDGQQRLTAITLIVKILNIKELNEPKLFYDSRPEVEAFFSTFYRTGKTDDVTFDYKVSHLINAVDIINESKLKPDKDNSPSIKTLGNDLQSFKNYFREKVIIVRVEIPEETDVANYFEIMNNRGEQLQKHEILKAKLIDKIRNENGEHDKKQQVVFAKIWDVCSQMDYYIQKLISIDNRKLLFGDNFDQCNINIFERLSFEDNISNKETIDDIIFRNEKIETIDEERTYQVNESIIDFPNFLMHLFKLLYNDAYKIATKDEKKEIPLNEKDLLTVFEIVKSEIKPMNFIKHLLYYRAVFDHFIIKLIQSDNSEDELRWSLEKPTKYESLDFKNSFDNQERIVKCLSMLQVTYRTKIYKNWLQEALNWFKDTDNFNITIEDYQKKLDDLVCKNFNENKEYDEITKENYYSKGTSTPHFLFNFIDYLYWVESKNKVNKITGIDFVKDFDFNYRNSVEHHRPQSRKQNIDDIYINCLGNLCLVSKNSNSKMNNEEPSGKAIAYDNNKLPPKRKIMYETTKNSKSKLHWGEEEILQHYKDIVDLLVKRKVILGLDK